MEVTEQNGKNKEASRKVTFNLPDDSETEQDTDMLNAKRDDSIAIKSSFEKRQEKVIQKF